MSIGLRGTLADGRIFEFPVTGPGGVERFAVGGPTFRSAVWRIWANRSTSDVFIAPRRVAHLLKFSLHNDAGVWRLAFVKGSPLALAVPDRTIDEWIRPQEPPYGWTPAVSIVVPHGELQEAPQLAREVYFLTEAAQGCATVLTIAVVTPTDAMLSMIGLPVGGFILAGGKAVIVIAGERDMPDDERRMIEVHRAAAIGPGNRVSLFGESASGRRVVYDLRKDNHEPIAPTRPA
jgi:hypothetical protein